MSKETGESAFDSRARFKKEFTSSWGRGMKLVIMVNAVIVGSAFGTWQQNTHAGIFVSAACIFILFCIDYTKQEGGEV